MKQDFLNLESRPGSAITSFTNSCHNSFKIMPTGRQTALERERHAGLEGLPCQEKTL